MQKKNMISIFVCMLLIAVSISSVTGTIDENESLNMKNDDYNNLIKQFIENGVISKNDWWEQDKLLASDGAADDYFGFSVSIDGDYAIIGAGGDDDNGVNSGSAYIFKRLGTSWIEQAKLLASDGAAENYFGFSVSIDGDYAIVGAIWDDDNGVNSGSAYIFKRLGTSWNEEAKLLASDGAESDRFGRSVSINGDYGIVGAYEDDDNGTSSGSAYIFKRDGTDWNEQAKLLASDGSSGDFFGVSVSISGDYAIIGAYSDDDNGDFSGSAYVFKRSGTAWTEQVKLLASDGADEDYFGWSVSIDGDYTIIGTPGYDDYNGSAYVFKRDGTSWIEQDKLLASDGAAEDRFGYSVSIDGDYAIVGAPYDYDNGEDSGSAYIFKRDGTNWNEQDKLLASDGAQYDYFGSSVSISGDSAVVGAYQDDDNGIDSGSAYVFTKGSGGNNYDYTYKKLSCQAIYPTEDYGYVEVPGGSSNWMKLGIHIFEGFGMHEAKGRLGIKFLSQYTGEVKITFKGEFSGNVEDSFGANILYYIWFRATKDNGNWIPGAVSRLFTKNTGYLFSTYKTFEGDFECSLTLNIEEGTEYWFFSESMIRTHNFAIPLPNIFGGGYVSTYTHCDIELLLYSINIEL